MTLSRLRVCVVLVWGLLGSTGCVPKSEPPAGSASPGTSPEVLLTVSTVDLQGKPVESVRFFINEKKYGITDQDGLFSGRFPARAGEVLTFNVEAPEGFGVPTRPSQRGWRVAVPAAESGRLPPVEFRAELERPHRGYVLMVRALPGGTAVKVDGRLIGQTSLEGDALLPFSGPPGGAFTATAGALTFTGTLSEDDELYLLTSTRSGPVASALVAATDPPAGPEQRTPSGGAAPGSGTPGGHALRPDPGQAIEPATATESSEALDARLERIGVDLRASGVLMAADVVFLGGLDRTYPGYYEAHRLLADFHHRNHDTARASEELALATSGGRYKRDPTLLLALAKSQARLQNDRGALATLQRVEENMRTLPADVKADAFRFGAETAERQFRREFDEAGRRANLGPLDKAIRRWERCATFLRGVDAAGAAAAEARIAALEGLKADPSGFAPDRAANAGQ